MTRGYTPHAVSTAGQVVAFFDANPEEELSVDDIVTKFNPGTRAKVHTLLSVAVEHGLLARSRGDDGEYVYRKGTGTRNPLAAIGGDLPNPREKRPAPEPSSLKFERDVPIPPIAHKPKPTWENVLRAFTVGDSHAFNLDAKCAIRRAISILQKDPKGPRFETRKYEELQQLRVWRIE